MSRTTIPVKFNIKEEFQTNIDIEDIIESMNEMNPIDRINLIARQLNDLDFSDLSYIEDLSKIKIIASWMKRQEVILSEVIKNRQNQSK